MTVLELFAAAYLTPREISIEANIPLATVVALRNGQPVQERDVKRVLRVVSARLGRTVRLSELENVQLLPDEL